MTVRFKLLCASIVPFLLTTGCYSTAAKIGVKVVGNAVHEVDVSEKEKRLVGQPADRADAEFGQPLRAFDDTRSKREVMIYPVKGDALAKFRWVVEVENSRIVALAKAQNDSDGSNDIIRKLLLKDKVIGKTPQAIEAQDRFKKLTLVLRGRATKNLVRVYDISGMTDVLGARYCVLEFNASDLCENIRLVGVQAATERSAGNR